MSATYTEKLHIIKVQPTDYFISDTFNNILDDIDSKVLGIDHLQTALHWTEWEENTTYIANDVVRWPNMKSHQYAKCITGGTSGGIEPGNNVTGSVLTEGSVTWKVMSLTEATDNSAPIMIWLGGEIYSRGDIVIYANALYRAKVNHTASGTFEPDKSKWQEIYASIRPWVLNKFYYEDDTVIVNNVIYKCNADHTSASTFTNIGEVPYWDIVGNLARASEWHSVTNYLKDQLITKNGLLYRAVETHTSSGVFTDDTLKWEPVFASIIPWTSNAWYDQDVVVYYNNVLYKCIDPHVSGENFDYSKWQLLHDPNGYVRDWIGSTHYYQNQLVRHNGNLYRCNTTNNDASFTIAKWDLLTDSINDWVGSRDYIVGQYVNYNGILYKCITANNDTNFTIFNWQKVSGGWLDQWEQNTDYIVGDVVVYANKIYQCTTAHTSGATFNADSDKWNEISACITRIPNWEANKDYVIGDLVSHDAKIFRCITSHTSESTWNQTEEAKWEELSPTINEISTWTPSTDYEVGQLVIYDNKLYRCNTNHTSDSTSFNTDIAYWDSIGASGIDAWKTGEAYQQGNMVVYNDKIYVCDTAHTSTNPFDYTKWHEVSTADIPLWNSNVEYLVGNNVIYNNKLYRCTTAHTSTSTFDVTKWEEISPTKLDDWQASTDYDIGDYVVNNNKIYKCTTAHTSTSDFDKSKWVEISSYDIGLWQTDTDYNVGNLVIQDNKIYRCNTAHTSDTTSFGVDIANWDEIGSSGIDNWEQNKLYSADNVVIYNNKIYKCITGHTSSTTFDPTKWVEVSSSDIDVWSVSTDYVVGDFVYKDNQLYRCITAHTSDSSDFDVDIAKWELLDTKWKAENWVASKLYTANEVVLYDNRIFKCISTHTSAVDFATDGNYWQALSAKLEPWKVSTYYTVGDTVINNNKLYKCIVAHTSDNTSMLTDASNWEIVGSGGIDTWKSNEDYTTSSVVIYNNKIYKCNTAHTSGSTFDPTKWDEISSADIGLWQSSTDYKVGNVVIKDNQIYRCKTLHTSDSSDFYTDIAKWDILDTKWQVKDWVTNTYYLEGEVVLYNNTPYKCTTAHTSLGTFELDKADWEPLSANIRQWVSKATYKVGDTVLYDGDLWKCITANNDASFRKDKWKQISKCNIEVWRGASDSEILALLHFDDSSDAGKNEYGDSYTNSGVSIRGGGKWNSCISLNDAAGSLTSKAYPLDNNEVYTIECWLYVHPNWVYGASGVNISNLGWLVSIGNGTSILGNSVSSVPSNVWTHYAVVVSSTECTVYVDGVNTVQFSRSDTNPLTITLDQASGQSGDPQYAWIRADEFMVSKGAKYTSNFTPPIEPFADPNYEGYKKDDLVVYNNKIYQALVDNNDLVFTPSKWVEVSKSIVYPDWSFTTDYSVDDIVIYQNQLYRCITNHISTNDFNDDFNKWTPLDKNCFIHNWASNIPYYVDEVVNYDDVLYRCKIQHVSDAGEEPINIKLYEASGNVIYVDDTTTIPYSEIIDLGSVKRVTDMDYIESTTGMSFTYTIEVSEDSVNYTIWDGVSVDARYIRLTVDSVNIDAGATSPNAHLTDFTVYGDSDKWEKISSGGSAEIVLARKQDIDEMFI